MFEKIENGENKSKIVDGIQVIILIAAGVLAIGTAFKIIGNVDFLSVISLSIGILAISYAFKEIAQIKELTPKNMVMVGLALIIMATSVTLSSYILQLLQPLDLATSVSLIMISGALGVAAYFLLTAIDKIKLSAKDIPKILLLPLILPAIAAGIAISSVLLQYVQPISFMQAISVAMVGLALVGGAIAFKFIASAIKDVSLKSILYASLAIPLIAGGIVVSSWIFELFNPIESGKMLNILVSSIVMGLSIIAFLPAMYVLGKMKIDKLIQGGLGIIITSTAMMLTSWILSIGNYDGNYPNLLWSFSVGLSILLFAFPLYILGKKMNPKDLLMIKSNLLAS
jgi:hypothetical protein